MPLPKIDKPLFSLKIPSTGKEVSYRPFLVKEEKILLMASEGGDQKEIFRAIKQVINNCVIDISFNVDDLALFDIEYFFINLRSKSIGNMIDIQITDPDLPKPITKQLDLDKVEIINLKKAPTIKINDTMILQTRYPKAGLANINFQENFAVNLFEIIGHLIDKLYDGDEVYNFSEYSQEEIIDFVQNLPVSVVTEITDFLKNMPGVYCKVEYEVNGEKRNVELNSLYDFFILG
jgi:hypothetical protein